MRLFVLVLSFTLAAVLARAECAGRDLLAGLAPDARDALVGDAPFARGLYWRARRDDAEVVIVGTLHLDDPRMDGLMATLSGDIAASDLVLVEAGPEEEAALKAAIAARPDYMFITDGPTLPEMLPEDDWQALSDAARARGIPPFLISKFQPWYVTMLLSVPACEMRSLAAGQRGLDHRVMAEADHAGVPVKAVEPFDTILHLFEALSQDQKSEMIRATLAQEAVAEDMMATLREAYFRGEIQLFWEFAVMQALETAGDDRAATEEAIALFEQEMLIDRNRSWVAPIVDHSAGKRVFVAVGAAHLPGNGGLLQLLAEQGFTIEAAALP
ncbi:MAG: TraB/GumN family protein [Paracoccaceae bacterium]